MTRIRFKGSDLSPAPGRSAGTPNTVPDERQLFSLADRTCRGFQILEDDRYEERHVVAKIGFGLWSSVAGTLVVESAIFALGVWLYLRHTAARNNVGKYDP